MSFREPMAHVRYGKNTELAGATPGVVRPMSTREADRAYRKAWRKNNPAWYTRLWRFLGKKRCACSAGKRHTEKAGGVLKPGGGGG